MSQSFMGAVDDGGSIGFASVYDGAGAGAGAGALSP